MLASLNESMIFYPFCQSFVYTHRWVSAGLSLLGTILDDQSFYMPTPVNQGGYFEVYIITSKELLEASFLHGTDNPPGPPLPKVVAVKGPKVRGKLNDRWNQKLWMSMAMELQILKHELVKDHENVVKLLGLCWRSIRGTFMPAFVLEAARSDLYSMIQSFEFTLDKMSTRKILGLAVDICSGLSVLHEVWDHPWRHETTERLDIRGSEAGICRQNHRFRFVFAQNRYQGADCAPLQYRHLASP